MATLNFPTLAQTPMQFTMQLRPNTQTFSSPLNGAVQTVDLPGAIWRCEVVYDSLQKADRLIMQAFLAQLRGRAGRAFLWDMSHPTPQGVATGAPVVNGAAQVGNTLITQGWTNSITGILKAGDLFAVNGELKRIVLDANSGATTGPATLIFEPPLRASPANSAVITVASPTFKAMLLDDDQDQYISRTVKYGLQDGGFTVKFVEAFT